MKTGLIIAVLCAGCLSFNTLAQESAGSHDGQVVAEKAWDAQQQQWVSLEQFWVNYAERSGGITWGRSAEYPEYDKVKEYDTLMIETANGPCLMEFFHERWRRANDVRRWDDKFNQHAGCPIVFD